MIYLSAIKDLTPLMHLDALEDLEIIFAPLEDLRPLRELRQIKKLSVSYSNKLYDINPIQNLVKLEYLNLQNNIIEDIQPLVDNPGLSEGDIVYLTYNCLDLLESSKAMKDIQKLEARGVQVEYEPQRDCSTLK